MGIALAEKICSDQEYGLIAAKISAPNWPYSLSITDE
jgi:hypothetical protein